MKQLVSKLIKACITGAIICCAVLDADVSAQEIRDPRAVFEAANDAYKQERFKEAIAGYRRLLAAGYRHPEIHFNLGNAYFRTGALGRALAQYERARRLKPRDPIYRANIQLVRNRTEPGLTRGELSGFLAGTLFWYRSVNRTEILALAAAVYVLLWLVLSARLVWRKTVLTRIAVTLVCVVALIAASVMAKFREERPGTRGTIVVESAAVRAGLDDESRALFELHDGAEFSIEENSAGWYRIALSDGKRGWVKAENIEPI